MGSTTSVSQRKSLQKYFGDNSREIMVSHADVLIRRYETKDYGFVCKLFYECLIENWIPAYRRVMSGSAPSASATQAAILIAAIALSPSFPVFLAIVSITQLALLFSTYYIYWAYAR